MSGSSKIFALILLQSLAFIFAKAQTYTFTNAGATGNLGPTQSDIDNNYSGTNLQNAVTITTRGIQEWDVPSSGTYSIEVYGAEGGAGYKDHGKGAKMFGKFSLQASQTLNIIVGQMGEPWDSQGGGGGGGSFVWEENSSTPLIIAGGGGGGSDNYSPAVSSYIHGSSENPLYYLTVGEGGNYGNSGSWAGGGGGVGIRMVLPKMGTVWVEAVFYLPMEWAVTIH